MMILINVSKEFTAMVCWFSETALSSNRTYLLMHTSQTSKAKITAINFKVNIQLSCFGRLQRNLKQMILQVFHLN